MARAPKLNTLKCVLQLFELAGVKERFMRKHHNASFQAVVLDRANPAMKIRTSQELSTAHNTLSSSVSEGGDRAGACLRGGGQPKLCKAAVRCATRKPGGRKVTLYTRCGSCRAPSTGPSRRGMASAPLASDSVTAEQYGNSACCGFEKLLGLCSDLQALPCTAHTGPTLGLRLHLPCSA